MHAYIHADSRRAPFVAGLWQDPRCLGVAEFSLKVYVRGVGIRNL